ncbi:MAG: CarD family transcriptional regulator [Clostridia bacterium]|nr:CarD family transcriptional regulator [Clostridia bacterium]
MFSSGDYVVYGDSDVCRITEIGVPDMKFHKSTGKQYYFLEPVFYKGAIYAPTDTQVAMRPVIGREEALCLIDALPAIEADACTSGDKKRMTEHYARLMEDHSCRALAQTAKSIFLKYHAAGMKNKLPNSTEASYYKKASELMLQELSVSLGEPVESVQKRIEAVVSPNEAMRWSL